MSRLRGCAPALAFATFLAAAGAAYAQAGASMCGGIAGLQCPSGSVCVMDGPSHPDQSGLCRMPDRAGRIMCPAIYQPVCGADGKTYSNRCAADRAAVAVAGAGQCGHAGPGAVTPADRPGRTQPQPPRQPDGERG